jgi:hypothetical protein
LTAPVPGGPLVEVTTHRDQTVFHLGGTEQRQHHGNETVAIGPPQGEHPEPAHVTTSRTIMDSRQQFKSFAPVATMQGIVDDEHLGCRLISQGEEPLGADSGVEQQEEATPVGRKRV